MKILTLSIFCLLLSSCFAQKRNWSKAKYKLMLWEFAAALEKNYAQLSSENHKDKNGKVTIKSVHHQHHHTKKKSKHSYLMKINEDKVYKPQEHLAP
tara:strand:+ start:17802 stop:18092 length:291 start_codon:yes stop_codon:yes gene_type:complete